MSTHFPYQVYVKNMPDIFKFKFFPSHVKFKFKFMSGIFQTYTTHIRQIRWPLFCNLILQLAVVFPYSVQRRHGAKSAGES